MKNTDPRVDAYISNAAAFAQPVLRRIRKLVHEACPESKETMKWSFPHFVYGGKILCAMASFKSHCAMGFWHQGMTEVIGRDDEKSETAMGSLGRITGVADLPSDRTLKSFIRKAADLNDSDQPTRPKPRRRPAVPPPVPSDLRAALKKNRSAAATFQKLSPSGQRDYTEWIGEAKRVETRQKRLATALEWLADGKSRNWKYERC